MSDLKVHRGEWVVVCDGAKALVLENIGSWTKPCLKTRKTYRHDAPKTHELGADAPGRAFASVGGMRSAMEQTDWHDQEERAFLEQLAERLHAAVMAGEVKGLIVVASPRALGILRDAFSPQVRAALRGEVRKDFVAKPVHEIEAFFAW